MEVNTMTRRSIGNHLIQLAHKIEPKLKTEFEQYMQTIGQQQAQLALANTQMQAQLLVHQQTLWLHQEAVAQRASRQ